MKKAQGLPVNVVVMIILGLFIFAMGIGLFARFSSAGDSQIDDLNDRIRTNIASLECTGGDWICTGTYKVKRASAQTFVLYLSNQELNDKDVDIEINLSDIEGEPLQGLQKDCGYITISTPPLDNIQVNAGSSTQIPFNVNTRRVNTQCTFITTAYVYEENNELGRTAIIINVE